MENNLENKARFFAMYWGQPIGMVFDEFWNKNLCYEVGKSCTIGEIDYIELKPLSSISDEDAIELVKIKYIVDKACISDIKSIGVNISKKTGSLSAIYIDGLVKHKSWGNLVYKILLTEDTRIMYQLVDYLRSKGYALPFHNLSVEDLIRYRWIKLKNGSQ